MNLLRRLLLSNWSFCSLLALLLLAASLTGCPLFSRLEYPLYDQLLKLRPPTDPTKVVLIAVDPGSRAQIGNWPWPRTYLAKMIQQLEKQQAKSIGLLAPLTYPEASQTLNGDRSLANSARKTKLIWPISRGFGATLDDNTYLRRYSLPQLDTLPNPQVLLLAMRNPLSIFRPIPTSTDKLLPPATPLRKKNSWSGHIIINPDPDHRVRSLPLLLPWQDRLLPALPLQLALFHNGKDLSHLTYETPKLLGKITFGTTQLTVLPNYRLLLDRSGSAEPFTRYSAIDLLNGKIADKQLRDKTVLIGPTDLSTDSYRAPSSEPWSAVELAAAETATLLNGAPLHRPFWAWLLESAILLYFTIILLLLTPRLSNLAGALTLTLFLLAWLAGVSGALILFGFWLNASPPFLLVLLGFPLVQWNRSRSTRQNIDQETNKMLGLSYQEQGQLDLALEKFLLFSPYDPASKELLYNLGLEFERKRMPQKALAAYRHLLNNGRYRDTRERAHQLADLDQTVVIGNSTDRTLILNQLGEKPTLGRYRIEKELGQGAMGTVYLGIDPKINRQVAIKTLAYAQIDPAKLTEIKERFFREAEAAGQLSHPHIVTIYDVGEENDLAYLAMELLKGKDLSHFCQESQLLHPYMVLQIIAQASRALDYAHRNGVIHRDIKPANLILQEEDLIKVADFGVARIASSTQTETGIILGTPSYMSPEQIAGKKVDGRSDLFSLGTVMYELLCGEKPFQGDSLTSLMYNISNGKYRPLAELHSDLPCEYYDIVGKLLHKNLTRRYKTADLLAKEVEALLQRLEK